MRARTFAFAFVCATATAALAQDSGYVRFPSPSAQACAVACSGDQMCASWSFGSGVRAGARSYGQSQTQTDGGMCAFSSSSSVRTSPGMASGLPPRDRQTSNAPMMSAPPTQNSQAYVPQQVGQSSAGYSGSSGWGVRPAPWLSGVSASPQQQLPQQQSQPQGPQQQAPGMPQQLRAVHAMPTQTPSVGPRIEFEPQNQSVTPQYTPPTTPRPTQIQVPPPAPPRVYAPPVPAYIPPPLQAAPILPAPLSRAAPTAPITPVMSPEPPPRTQAMPSYDNDGASTTPPIALPKQVRAGSGTPVRQSRTTPSAASLPDLDQASAVVPEASGAPVVAAPAPRRTATRAAPRLARPTAANAPTASSTTAATTAPPPAPLGPQAAAPARQATMVRPAPGRGTPRPPVRDPNDPESFRGADGMIDAAEMRRAQLNAAREQGTPAYSVQREWEAVAAERQRADEAGEVRVDPLAGTVPVAPPPETRAQKRAREAEEALVAAQEERDAARADGDNPQETTEPTVQPRGAQRGAQRGARGKPRPKATPPQTSQNQEPRQVASRTSRPARRAPAQALDREPRLSGGPG